MPKRFAQLEFGFSNWIRKKRDLEKKPEEAKLPPPNSDSEMTRWCQQQARSLKLPELSRKVSVSWNPRMRTTAGRAMWPSRKIEINPKIKQFSDHEVWRTLKHEFAHLVAYERSGRKRIRPHGIEWQTACSDLGIPRETTTHSLPLKGRRMKKKFTYTCPSCLIETQRVRPFKRVVACYTCCRKFNSGQYHDRFRLVKSKI
ncbi:MAG: SprT-like domain-containing protein [Akkermansiaceae bacterium]